MKRKMIIEVNERPQTCPKCGGKVVEIIYGEPTQEAYERSLEGEFILGGCCINIDENGQGMNPQYGCIDCGRQFIIKQ